MILNVYNNFYLQVKNTELWNGREKKKRRIDTIT